MRLASLVALALSGSLSVAEAVHRRWSFPLQLLFGKSQSRQGRASEQLHVDFPTCPLGGPGPWGPRKPDALRILVHGAACGGLGCEARAGSERIEGTNFGNGLRLLGHEVRFRDCGQVEGADVVIARPGTSLEALRAGDPSRIVVAMKTDSKSQWDWVKRTDLHMANSAIHSLFHSAHGGLSLEDSVVLRLLEVPTTYWTKRLRDDPNIDMYSSIPLHRVIDLKEFGAERPVRLCYHGNPYHFTEETGMVTAIKQLAREFHLPMQLSLIQDANDGLLQALAGIANLTVTHTPWTSMDTTFKHLAGCDLGLVPNVEEDPTFAVNSDVGNPQINIKYKGSTNAGRAYVMAQVGLPFVTSPEPESAELLGGAGLRSHEFLAMGADAWAATVAHLLRDTSLRSRASKALRAYAERELNIETEVVKLEQRIKAARAARSKDSTFASAVL